MSSFEIGAAGPVGAVQPQSQAQFQAQSQSQSQSQSQAQAQSVQLAGPIAAIASAPPPTVGQAPGDVRPPGQVNAAAQVQTSLTVSAGTIPVDQTRVDQIRKAVQSGTYPLIPAKIGDAMVAAGLILRKPR